MHKKMELDEQAPVITIDGTSGSGKGTIGLLVANKLGWHYLDSGALYRVLAYFAQLQGVDIDLAQAAVAAINMVQQQNVAATSLAQPDVQRSQDWQNLQNLIALAHKLPVEFRSVQQGLPAEVYLAGELVTKQIRTEASGLAASKIAVIPEVREALLARQRAFLIAPGLVADGRDMGTVVFPQAKLKIFLQASVEERAKRRYNQLKAMGLSGNLQGLIGEIAMRDEQDRTRAVAPTKPAAEAIVIDTTSMDIHAVFNKVMELWLDME